MKRVFLTLSVALLTVASAFAGGDRSSDRYLYAKWYQNWFIDASGSLNAWQQSVNRAGFVDLNTLNYKNAAGDFGRFGGSVKIGKLLNPCVGIRLGLDMNQATYQKTKTSGKTDFVLETAHLDLMLSLMDFFGGYRNDRIYRMILFAGFGVSGHPLDPENKFFVFDDLNKEFCAVAGLMNNFRLGKSFDFHIDLQAIAPKYTIEQQYAKYDKNLVNLNLSAAAGLTWYIGGRHFDVCSACPEIDCPEVDCSAKDKEIKNLQDRIAELQANAGNTVVSDKQPCDTVVKFINGETAPMSIFFNKDSYQIRDNRDLINLQEIAKVAKDNGYKVNLRGTCDSATATSAYNKKLAENRCRKIKDELVKLGVAESNIILDVVGGVNELKPAEYNRRVLVTFSK